MNTTATQKTETTNVFPNIENEIRDEASKRLKEFRTGLDEQVSIDKITNSWFYSELMTKGAKDKVWVLSDLKNYLVDRKTKSIEKRLTIDLSRLKTISASGELISATITVEWKKSAMWGSNPRAEARIQTTKDWFVFDSGSIGGCGYDKCSTAVANVLNQCNAVLNAMYQLKNDNVATPNRELFGYGSGSMFTPHLEGGVGVSCYPEIFAKLGYEFKTTASGKSFDVFTITKKVN